MPTIFRVKPIRNEFGEFGYIRIFTFNVEDENAFIEEFVRLIQLLPQNGLIIDVRNNGGGLIYAAERLLQVLTSHPIEPQRAQFINTLLTLEICRQHAPSKVFTGLDLTQWIQSIEQSVETGASYSLGYPITPPESCKDIGQKYFGPVLLITDALCYSATDMFVAGFQDHRIGKILGTSGNTGAGGANVWTHALLDLMMRKHETPLEPLPSSPFKPLPFGTGMRVAVRRTLRVGPNSDVPVEDLGIIPDERYYMTREDLVNGNVGLIHRSCQILSG
jgi:C-terminal processing protease CtpA/Prc